MVQPQQPQRPRLPARQADVLQLAAEGLRDEDIAERLEVSVDTAKTHIKRLYETLGAHNRAHAVAMGCRLRLVDLSRIQPRGVGEYER